MIGKNEKDVDNVPHEPEINELEVRSLRKSFFERCKKSCHHHQHRDCRHDSVAEIANIKIYCNKHSTFSYFQDKCANWYKPEINHIKIQCEISQKPEKECFKEGCYELDKV